MLPPCFPTNVGKHVLCLYLVWLLLGVIHVSTHPSIHLPGVLGTDGARQRKHQRGVDVMIGQILGKGGKMLAHVNWEQAEQVSVSIIRTTIFRIEEPTLAWLPMADYTAEFGDTEDYRSKGHTMFAHNQVAGVQFPESNRVRSRSFKDLNATHTTLGTTTDQDARTEHALGIQHDAVGASSRSLFTPGSTNNAIADAVGIVLIGIAGSSGGTAGSSGAPRSAITRSISTAARASTPTYRASAPISNPGNDGGAAASRGVPATTSNDAGARRTGGQKKVVVAKKPLSQSTPSGSGGGGAAGGRGRPPRDW